MKLILDYKYRLVFFAIFVAVFLLAFWMGTNYKMTNDEAQEFLKGYNDSTQGIDAPGIFLHNIPNALAMFIPGIGIAWGAYNAWSTGAAFSILLLLNPVSPPSTPVAVLLSRPYGIMELVSYGIAMSQSLFLLLVLVKRKSIKKELYHTMIQVGIVSAILLVAAFVESSMM